jgi:ribose 5-phosphate isomerase B
VKIVIGSDHAGYALKESVRARLVERGEEVDDLGTAGPEPSVDYPDFAQKVAGAVASGRAERGILVCGTGIGMSMAANRIDGVRAALCHDHYTARLGRAHNDANVLCLGGRTTGIDVALEIVEAFLETEFEGGRHQRRVNKIHGMENVETER